MAEAEPKDAVGRSAGLVEITNAIVALHKEFYGRGPIKARSTLDRDLLVVVLEGGFTQAERTLSESGRSSAVDQARHNMQDVIKDHWIAAVERLLGRQVRCFLSASDPTQEVQVETFLLEPTASSGS
ncbi:MAG TPA: Na-translocating system protein MpsC family protein [Thermoleophilaceae bacterium]